MIKRWVLTVVGLIALCGGVVVGVARETKPRPSAVASPEPLSRATPAPSRGSFAQFRGRGGLDASFGRSGRVVFGDPKGVAFAEAIAVQADQKLVVAGWASPVSGAMTEFTLWRLMPDGAPDLQFGTAGRATPFPASQALDTSAEDALIDPEGRIVAVGSAEGSDGESGLAVVRYLAGGAPDPTFGGGDGAVVLGGDGRWAGCTQGEAVARQPDGKLVVVGSDGCGGEAGGVQVVAVRLDASGELDASFAHDGVRTFDFGHCGGATDVAVQTDMRLLISGIDGGCYEETGPFRIARLDSDGTFDTRFGRGGRQRVGFALPRAGALAMALDARDRIVLIGFAGPRGDSGRDRVALARLKSDGVLDRRFGDGGTTTAEFAHGRSSIASDVVPLRGGGLVVAGALYTTSGDAAGFAVAAFTSRGALKRSFGTGGVRIIDFQNRGTSAEALAGDQRGRIVSVGQTGTRIAVARLRAR